MFAACLSALDHQAPDICFTRKYIWYFFLFSLKILLLWSARSLSVYPYQCPGQEENQEVLKEVQRLRLRMEDLEAAVTEQQDRCNGLASELQTKAQHAQADAF